jgi:hypothetical protein
MVSSDDKNCESKIKHFDVRFVIDKLKEIENLSSLCNQQMTQIKRLEHECMMHKNNHGYLEKQLKDILNPQTIFFSDENLYIGGNTTPCNVTVTDGISTHNLTVD